MDKPLLGILGGLGPMSSAYFYELITRKTKADKDQEHIDIILSSRASTPDRTDYIMGRNTTSPLPQMISDARALERYGATAIVIPCNTAHYFIDEVRRSVNVPVPSIISETVSFICRKGCKKAGILATEGTIFTGSYQAECEKAGIAWAVPGKNDMKILMDIIYNCVKSGVEADPSKLLNITETLEIEGCDCVILGCTELSVIARDMGSHPLFCDSLEVLAKASVKLCGKEWRT